MWQLFAVSIDIQYNYFACHMTCTFFYLFIFFFFCVSIDMQHFVCVYMRVN